MTDTVLTFKQRMGIDPIQVAFQFDSISDDLRRELWNVFFSDIYEFWSIAGRSKNTVDLDLYDNINGALRHCWQYVLKHPLDELPTIHPFLSIREGMFPAFKRVIFDEQWGDVYQLFENFVRNLNDGKYRTFLIDHMNIVLKNNNSGYVFISTTLSPRVSDSELDSIRQALEAPYDSVSEHLAAALAMLSDKKKPDYRNSIKESISAVEAICKVIAGKPNATLGVALGELQKKQKFNAALLSAFEKIYGYTNDTKNGIRHAFSEEIVPVGRTEAQFMLVACSAFINYTQSIHEQA